MLTVARVKKILYQTGCSQSTLAVLAGTSPPHLSQFLNGKAALDPTSRRRLESVLRSIAALVASSPMPVDFKNPRRIKPLLRRFQQRADAETQEHAGAVTASR